MMNGRQRVAAAFARQETDRPATMPIIHSALAGMCDIPLGQYFTDAAVMADVIIRGYRRFGYDGVQLSLGVTAEAHALGATVEQPADGSPQLQQHLLEDISTLDSLRGREVPCNGRFPMFFDAVRRTLEAIGDQCFVLSTIRGPLLTAAQLRGAENIMMDMFDDPDMVRQLLEYTTQVSIEVGRAAAATGTHGILIGEATCSPNFISPNTYRQLVQPFHRTLVEHLHQAAPCAIGLHICGDTTPIIDAVADTGCDFLDVDHQVTPSTALEAGGNRLAFRGNLDPSDVFAFGSAESITTATRTLVSELRARDNYHDDMPFRQPWVLSSGCDISPGAPADNLAAFVEAIR